MRTLNLGLLGLGQIGSGVYRLLTRKKDYFARQIGVRFEFRKIAEKNPSRAKMLKIPPSRMTREALSVVQDPEVDIVIELIGGTRHAYSFVMESLRRGKHVVTANKALIAERGNEIFSMASRRKRWLGFEASVGGGIPVMKALREGLVANRIESIHSIINGTSNYILTQMTEEGMDFAEALSKAQEKGYAEADPTLDIDGSDAAHKLAILTRCAFGGKVRFRDIYREGIDRIRGEDISFAKEFGYRIKLLAIAKKNAGGIEARVQPTLLPAGHILASVNDSFNAVLIRGDEVGDTLFYGRGAGAFPTASAVVSDLVDIAKRERGLFEGDLQMMRANGRPLVIKAISSILSRYYLRFSVIDRPGVLARISRVLGTHRVSISDCVQKERKAGSVVPLIMLTHEAHERDIRNAIRQIDRLEVIKGRSQMIRIEESK